MAKTYGWVNRVRTNVSGAHPDWDTGSTVFTLPSFESIPRDASAAWLETFQLVHSKKGFRRAFNVPLSVADTWLVLYFEPGVYRLRNDGATNGMFGRMVAPRVDSTLAAPAVTKFTTEEVANPSDPFNNQLPQDGGTAMTSDGPNTAAGPNQAGLTKHHLRLRAGEEVLIRVREFTKIGFAQQAGGGDPISIECVG